MKAKHLVGVVLGLFVVASLAYVVIGEATAKPAPEAAVVTPEAAAETGSAPAVTVYYFHGAQRCPTCRSIEANTSEAVQREFAALLDEGSVRLETRNIDEAEHSHFVKDFELVTSGVVLAEEVNGSVSRWTNLKKVWEYAHEADKLQEYVVAEVEAFLGNS
jgi:hypothetical protein